MEQVGKWAFIVGLVIAVVGGLGIDQPWFVWVLVVLGLVVGFLNVTAEETQGFLLASIALVASASAVRSLPYIGEMVTAILGNLVTFVSAALLLVALKALLQTAKD